MKSKVALYDSDGSQVGETFSRRARQLVQQQRAEWIGDSAIRFAPDAVLNEEEWRAIEEPEAPPATKASDILTMAEAPPVVPKATSTNSLLFYLAEKRIQARKLFLVHSLALIPGYIFIIITAIFLENVSRGGVDLGVWFLMFSIGAWTTPYMIHAFIFIRQWLKESSSRDDGRHARMVALEMDKLKRLGYND